MRVTAARARHLLEFTHVVIVGARDLLHAKTHQGCNVG